MDEVLEAGSAAYGELKNLIVWVKDNGGMGTFYRSRHELIFAYKHGAAPHINSFELGQHGRYRTNVWEYKGVNTRKSGRMDELALHPTVKPVAMIADAIKDVSPRNGIVLDLFGGSGSTLIAAHKTGRRARVCEIDPVYCDRMIVRWETFAQDTADQIACGFKPKPVPSPAVSPLTANATNRGLMPVAEGAHFYAPPEFRHNTRRLFRKRCPPRYPEQAIVAALIDRILQRISVSSLKCPLRSSAGSRMGNNALRRLPQIRSEASHNTIKAPRAASSYSEEPLTGLPALRLRNGVQDPDRGLFVVPSRRDELLEDLALVLSCCGRIATPDRVGEFHAHGMRHLRPHDAPP